jgi:hypothetical protein
MHRNSFLPELKKTKQQKDGKDNENEDVDDISKPNERLKSFLY